ncbi:hypothetical protein AJ79_05607 [Helicocarpus griseus UAMH5409]|uniref:37S ribosomal protein Rsm22 n=1 Tax=Helicocarpus griseus UAMH5409 TaxID=1447875 RepID=A0A2B7XLR8_9EURO|nr:hypothetical protein AJ79_05607 [Helicocarpus griseus UAMH5409]
MLSKRSSNVCTACSQAWIQRFSSPQALRAHQAKKGLTSHIRRPNSHRFHSSHSPVTSGARVSCTAPVRKVHNGVQQRFSSSAAADGNPALYDLIENIHHAEDEIAQSLKELELAEAFPHLIYSDNLDLGDSIDLLVDRHNEADIAAKVAMARQHFRDSLPDNLLNEEEMRLYKTLYGEPILMKEEAEVEVTEPEQDQLFREDGKGGWVEVEQTDADNAMVEAGERGLTAKSEAESDIEAEMEDNELSMEERASSIARMLGGEVVPSEDLDDLDDMDEEYPQHRAQRTHPLTQEGKFTVGSKSLLLPNNSMIKPVSRMLKSYSNKHIAETSHRLFGGRNLPHSTSTPPKNIPPAPIQLDAGQHVMSEIESHAYLAVLYPGIYASVLPILVEVRKRLGSKWLRNLMAQEGGPKVLDAGGGGAGILAWREVLKAEWSLMSPDSPPGSPVPFGKSTVLTGSHSLRHRASTLLENTTFLPRLPDYVHVRDQDTTTDDRSPPQRKQFDVIIAPHNLWPLREDYHRKEQVENLWSLLNPNGGVLILLEKGHQRGFEAIAGAREMILERHISSPGSTQYENITQSPDSAERFIQKGKGMIVAPCTNHSKCPMYLTPGKSIARKDFCHFKQRYIRPAYLQRIRSATDRNHEDVKFSYVAIQRGVDLRETDGVVQGEHATDAAFAGYENKPSETYATENAEVTDTTPSSEGTPFHPLSLPRLILPPLKRQGHVTLDLCTPRGKIERWTVTRSTSKQAYRDARKSAWGDLWALGAKSQAARNLKLGFVDDKAGKRSDRRSNKRSVAEDAADEAEMGGEVDGDMDELRRAVERLDPHASQQRISKKPEKKSKAPAWVKKMEARRERRAAAAEAAATGDGEVSYDLSGDN